MVNVRLEDWVHGHYTLLKCPAVIMFGNEAVVCKLIKTTMEVQINQGFLSRLFRIKPRVLFMRQPGFYDYFFDGKELVIKCVITFEKGSIIAKPDIVLKDMIEYSDYQSFVKDVYNKVSNILSTSITMLGQRALLGVDVAKSVIDSFIGLTATIQELSRHNVNVVDMVNTALSGANISIDTLIQSINEIFQKYRWVLTPPPPTQQPGVVGLPPMQLQPQPQSQPQQQQSQQQQG